MQRPFFVLGLDLGTSGLRAVLCSENGVIIGAAECKYSILPQNGNHGFSEQNPADWTRAIAFALSELRLQFPDAYSSICSIGVSGHMHGACLLDENGNILRPCILWNDSRSHLEAAELDTAEVRQISGNIIFPGFTAPKLIWVKKNEPEIFAKTCKVLLPAGYINYWLTGDAAADLSDSAGTSWLDVKKRVWSPELLNISGMRLDQMPRLVEGCAPIGTVQAERAAELQLPINVMVVGGAGDNAAAACGVGVLSESEGFVSLGTSGVILTASSQYSPLPDAAVHTFCHAIPERWVYMGVTLAAADCLAWLSTLTGKSAAEMAALLGSDIHGPSAVHFYPYLSGERTPHNDAFVRGAFTGLDRQTNLTDMCQAVVEGVSYALRDCLEALRVSGTHPHSLLAIGGGSLSQFWLKTLATVLNLPLEVPEQGEFGASLGAARLALMGFTGKTATDIMVKPPIAHIVLPDRALRDAYESAYANYESKFKHLKALQ